jgi:16S rRNA (guanine1207-N2)-methyltransferase
MTPDHADHYYAEHPLSKEKFGLIKTFLKGKIFKFTTGSGVFSVKRIDPGTRLLIETMILPNEGNILDLGCGYGPVGIVAAKIKPKTQVYLTDINQRAVFLARKNAERNRVYNTKILQGNMYYPVKGLLFSCILSNPPISVGMKTVKTIIEGASENLEENGTLQMVVRSKIGKKSLPEVFSRTFDNCAVLAIESGYRVLIGVKSN